MYKVLVGQDVHEFENRTEAVKAAKRHSRGWRGTVRVESEREFMFWRNGSLVEGRFVTSDRMRRGARA